MTVLPQPTREQLDISRVLEALSNPIRQRVVAQLATTTDFTFTCGELLPDLPKSTATHHWRMLRDSGVVEVERIGREFRAGLRREDLDARFPGLLDAVLAAVVPVTPG